MKWNILLVGITWISLTEVAASTLIKRTGKLFPSTEKDLPSLGTKNSAERWLLAGNNATFYSNGTVRVVCKVSGNQSANVTWLVNGQAVDDDFMVKGIMVQNDSLVLRNGTRLSGFYTCVADKEHDVVNLTSFIEYVDPEAPQIHSYLGSVSLTENHNEYITVGTNATVYGRSISVLLCNATGLPPPDIRWSTEGGTIFTKLSSKNKLFLFHNPAQSGEYTCEAKNYLGSAKRSSFIRFIEPARPFITRSRKKIFAINGENNLYLKIGDEVTTIAGTAVDIQCLASGVPEPDITWYHNGVVCQKSHLVNLNAKHYFFNKAMPSNASGNYTCVAKNAFGTASATSSILVIEPVFPYINSSENEAVSYGMTRPFGKIIGGSLKTLVGVSIWLECPAGGIPRPKIRWYKDNIPISAGKRVRILRKRVYVLGTIMSDTGWYSCRVSNGAGTVATSTFVQLLAPERPRIRRVKNRRGFIVDNLPTPFSANVGINLRILVHREVTIHCFASGFPQPVLSWRRNGKPIVKKDNVIVAPLGKKLIFHNLTLSQRGTYSCVASNAAGQDVARTTIYGRLPRIPKVELTRTVYSQYRSLRRNNMEIYPIALTEPVLVRGSDVILECRARQGYPKSQFTWSKDGKPLHSKTYESFNRSRLKLRNVQRSDEGTYKCFAENIVGEHETTIKLFLKSK